MRIRSIVWALVLVFSGAQAATVTNNIVGIGPKDAPINPYFCIQNGNGQVTYSLAPGETIDANKYSGNPYYVGGALRFNGCDGADTYLGYLGLSVGGDSNSINTYDSPEGVHIAYTNRQLDTTGSLQGQINYTAIEPNFNLLSTPPRKNAVWPFVGANLSGLEFDKTVNPVVIPNLSKEDAQGSSSDLGDTQSFLNAGMNTIRVPVSWGYLQLEGAGQGEISLDYYNAYVKPLLETLTSARVNTIVDLHAYMRYSKFGKEYSGCSGMEGSRCPDGTLILDANAYVDVWSKLYTLMKNDPKIDMNYIMIDIVNEPVDVPDDKVFTIQAAVIKSLRQQGFNGYILVEGNAWTGLHSWTTKSWKSTDGQTIYTNENLFTRARFRKAGIMDLSKIVINVHQYFDYDYSGTHDQCVTDLTTTGDNGFNLHAFTDYLQQNKLQAMVTEFGTGREEVSCKPALTSFLNYMKDNAATADKNYGFIGWTIWSTGHGWGDYNLRVRPDSYQMQAMEPYF